ncbi:hypothetical protein SEHO0A_02237 [Salmonella enterica subsp. houtenae str. ATCC BAA-1581]|nr:hypothetical protein SEHO0A_02237 [Salmonella enterica subsp. houtenae str. ATCC BAA-1581]
MHSSLVTPPFRYSQAMSDGLSSAPGGLLPVPQAMLNAYTAP